MQLTQSYAIRGGVPGRERLRVVARVMRPAALQILARIGIAPGMSCLDVGSGGGDLAQDLAVLVAPGGRVLGIDIDEIKIELAREEARQRGVDNVAFAVQPIGLNGEAKVINALTLENIADAVLEDGLATADEIAELVKELYAFAADPTTLAGTPRIIQAWGTQADDETPA